MGQQQDLANLGKIIRQKYFSLSKVTRVEEFDGIISYPFTVSSINKSNEQLEEEHLTFDQVLMFFEKQLGPTRKTDQFIKPKILRVCYGKMADGSINKEVLEVDVSSFGDLSTISAIRKGQDYILFKLEFYFRQKVGRQCFEDKTRLSD